MDKMRNNFFGDNREINATHIDIFEKILLKSHSSENCYVRVSRFEIYLFL